MGFTWAEHLSVGNALIDSDHKVLFCLINGVAHAIEIRDCSVLSQVFELLDSRLCSHFQNEEFIAEAVNMPFAKHKQAQQFILKELGYLKGELLGKNGLWCEAAVEHFSESLRSLLLDHILRKDMLMKPTLQEYPYDFTVTRLDRGFLQNPQGYMKVCCAQ